MKKTTDNIILIGMPACGKSTIGVILAKIIGYDFIDSDLLIQKKAGKRLEEIIHDLGDQGFLALEGRVNSELDVHKTVIATGGSAVYHADAMKHLQEIGTVVYLKASYPAIKKRLGNFKHRGVVLKEGQTLKDLYEERTKLYEKYSDLTISEDNKDAEIIITELATLFQSCIKF